MEAEVLGGLLVQAETTLPMTKPGRQCPGIVRRVRW
jgi:hypothetical protein